MPVRVTQHRLTYGPLSPLRTVEATRDGLVETRLGGVTRTTPWRRVRGVRWRRSGMAEVVFEGRVPLRLPPRARGLADTVARIEEEACAALDHWGNDAARATLIREWLGIDAGERWQSGAQAARLGDHLGEFALVVLAGSVVPLLVGLLMGNAWAGAAVLFGVVAIALAVLLGQVSGANRRHVVDPVSADGHSLATGRGPSQRTIAWQALTGVRTELRADGMVVDVDLLTAAGAQHFRAGEHRAARLLSVCRRVVRANRARFEPGGPQPVADTALSPARLTGESDAERGLSQSKG